MLRLGGLVSMEEPRPPRAENHYDSWKKITWNDLFTTWSDLPTLVFLALIIYTGPSPDQRLLLVAGYPHQQCVNGAGRSATSTVD